MHTHCYKHYPTEKCLANRFAKHCLKFTYNSSLGSLPYAEDDATCTTKKVALSLFWSLHTNHDYK